MATRKGVGIITDPDLAREIHMDTIMCVHCGMHWIPVKGSGKVRGYCCKCNGPTCGPQCHECIPNEKFVDLLETHVNPLLTVDVKRLPKSVPTAQNPTWISKPGKLILP